MGRERDGGGAARVFIYYTLNYSLRLCVRALRSAEQAPQRAYEGGAEWAAAAPALSVSVQIVLFADSKEYDQFEALSKVHKLVEMPHSPSRFASARGSHSPAPEVRRSCGFL